MSFPDRVNAPEGAPPIPQNQQARLDQREIRRLQEACRRAFGETDRGMNRLLEVAAVIVGLCIALIIGINEVGIFLGCGAAVLVDLTSKTLYASFKDRDLELASAELESGPFLDYLARHNVHPTVHTIARIWKGYNEYNLRLAL